LIYKGLVKHR